MLASILAKYPISNSPTTIVAQSQREAEREAKKSARRVFEKRKRAEEKAEKWLCDAILHLPIEIASLERYERTLAELRAVKEDREQLLELRVKAKSSRPKAWDFWNRMDGRVEYVVSEIFGERVEMDV